VTREDWLRAARHTLVSEGIERVKVAVLAEDLGVARSSFYWYFTDREQLTGALLDEWALHNTVSIVERAERPAATITGALLTVFECYADRALFDAQLEFAVREWARRDDRVRTRLAEADTLRINALATLHRRFGYERTEALVRARVHYHSQIGMYALAVEEPQAERFRLLPAYIRVFTGVDASPAELDRFRRWVRSIDRP
jgi:AcrR family transcriptional regulator